MAVRIKAESVLLIPVPEAAPLVHQYRLRYDPSAPAGVPEHITVLYPFLAPDQIDAAVLAMLRAIFSAISPIPFTLRHTAWFEQGVLYLAPDPVAPLVALTHQLSDACGVLPFEGRYPEVIPHLTIAQHGPKDILSRIAADVAEHLPIDLVASEAWVMVGHNETGWVLRERFPFAGS